jgi:hypothetical protein
MRRTIGTKALVLLLVILMMKITSATSSSSGEAMRRVGFEEDDGDTSSSSSLSRRSLKDVHLGFSHSGETKPVAQTKLSPGLTIEHIQKIAKDNTIIVTWANHHYLDFARNWINHVQNRLGLNNFIVGAMDEKMYESLKEEFSGGVHTWLMGSQGISKEAVKNDFGWGTKNFHQM